MMKSLSTVSSTTSFSRVQEDEEWEPPLSLLGDSTHNNSSTDDDARLSINTTNGSHHLETTLRRIKWPCFLFAYGLQVFVYGCKLAAHFSETTLAAAAAKEGEDAEITPTMAMTSIVVWNSLMDICAWVTAIAVLYLPEEHIRIWMRNLLVSCSSTNRFGYNNHTTDVAWFRRHASNWFLQGFLSAIMSTGWYLLQQYQRSKHQRHVPIRSTNSKNNSKKVWMIHLLCLPWIIHFLWFCRLKTTVQNKDDHKRSKFLIDETWLTWLKIIVVTTVYIFLGSEMAHQHFLLCNIGAKEYDETMEDAETDWDNINLDDLSMVDDYYG